MNTQELKPKLLQAAKEWQRRTPRTYAEKSAYLMGVADALMCTVPTETVNESMEALEKLFSI